MESSISSYIYYYIMDSEIYQAQENTYYSSQCVATWEKFYQETDESFCV